MKTIDINLNDLLTGSKKKMTAKMKAFSKKAVMNFIKKNNREISGFIGGFGEAAIYVTDGETGEVLCEGKYSTNVFSGISNVELV